MTGRFALALLLGAAMPLSAALAQTAPAPAEPAALELARILMTRDETLYDDADLTRVQARIENALLASDGACNPFVAECRAAATIVAREFAPAFRQSERARAERITAALLGDSLGPAEMANIVQYLRGGEGGRFLDALAMLRNPERTQRRRREIERGLARTSPDAMVAARARFRQRTRNLPAPAPR